MGILAAPTFWMVGSKASTSIFPLKGAAFKGSFPSAQSKSIPVAPENSILARVVSKSVLLIMVLPLPPTAANNIFSEALPWCVGITNCIPVIRLTIVSKR